MAAGLPVIISRQCYFPEVAEAHAGLVIDPDPEQLCNGLSALLDNPKRSRQMGSKARQLVLDRYTWNAVAEQMVHLYNSIHSNGQEMPI